MRFRNWNSAATYVRRELPAHESVRVEALVHPQRVGFVSDSGLPPGVCGDWRLRLDDGTGLHAQDNCDGSYDVHWDRVDPTCGRSCRIRHGAVDAPIRSLALTGGSGAAVGYLFAGKAGAGWGAALGVGAWLLAVALTK